MTSSYVYVVFFLRATFIYFVTLQLVDLRRRFISCCKLPFLTLTVRSLSGNGVYI